MAQSQYADYLGHKVHYQLQGQGDTTLVFIHGWSCDTEFWKYQTPALTADYRVILVDLPDTGKAMRRKLIIHWTPLRML